MSMRVCLSGAKQRRRRATAGFTLLEVMVAVVIMAMGVVVLLQAQARTIWMAQQARSMTVASQLIRGKLYDCTYELQKRGFSEGDYKDEGKFDDEGYDDFFWECHAYKPDLPLPQAGDIGDTEGALGSLMGSQLPEGVDPGQALAANPFASMGLGMLVPVLGTVFETVSNSLRELVVIVRWKDGDDWDELRIATHIVDPQGVKLLEQMSQQVEQATGSLPQIPGMPSMGGGTSTGSSTTGSSRGGSTKQPPAALPRGR